VAGGQIVPKKILCDRIEKDGWDGCQGQKFVRGIVVSIFRGETHQPTHNNQKIRQASGGTTRREASGRRITRREGRGGQRKTLDRRPRPLSVDPTHNTQIEKRVGGGQHDERGGGGHARQGWRGLTMARR
jgi:hypothetical protein